MKSMLRLGENTLVTRSQVPIGTAEITVTVTTATSVAHNMPTGGKSFARRVVRN